MPFAKDGFLAPEIDRFRATLRNVPTYRQWFEFAESLNRLGLDILRELEVPESDRLKVAMTTLFIRAHQSFQAALVLAERGLLGDARALLRSAIEGAIALNALNKDAEFLSQLTDAHQFNLRKKARLILKNSGYRSYYEPEQIREMEETIRSVDSIDAMRISSGKEKLSDIVWANVANMHCPDLYDLIYRALSEDGTHTNINSMNRHMEYDAQGSFSGFKVGPSISDLVTVLDAACLMFLWAARPFASVTAKEFIEKIEAEVKRSDAMPRDEPTEVSISANS